MPHVWRGSQEGPAVVATKGKRTQDKADKAYTLTCSFCGEQHRRRSKELAACREAHRKGRPVERAPAPPVVRDERNKDEPASAYLRDPLRGDKRAHTIVKMTRSGWPPRKIAKTLDISVDVVKDTLARIA